MQAVRVALVMPREGIYQQVALGVNVIAASRGWSLDFAHPAWDVVDFGGSLDRRLMEVAPDAVVIGRQTWPYLPRRLIGRKPVVGAEIDLTAEGLPSVVVNNHAAGGEAAQHLICRGFQSFAAYGLVTAGFARERAAGFRQAVLQAGLAFTDWYGSDSGLAPTSIDWVHQVEQWLKRIPRPAGVLCCCDPWAWRLLDACRALRLRVPEDVAIVSVDNQELDCEICRPPLSSVVIPWQRIGVEVALIIERQLAGNPVPAEPTYVGPTGVKTRRSSDTVAVSDPDVAAALAAIHHQNGRPMGVPDVLRHVSVNRRELERKFKRLTGRTIMAEVRQQRVEQAKRLLATTDLPNTEIALRAGFSSASKLALVFKQHTGLAPGEYRRRVGVS